MAEDWLRDTMECKHLSTPMLCTKVGWHRRVGRVTLDDTVLLSNDVFPTSDFVC